MRNIILLSSIFTIVLDKVPQGNDARIKGLELEKQHAKAHEKNLNQLIHKRP